MRDWRGLIALVLALGIAVTLVAGIITAELTPGPITSEEVSLLSTLAGAVIGAVATYLGLQHKGVNGMTTETPPTPDPKPEPVEPETTTPEPETTPESPEPPTDDDGNPVDEDGLTEGMGPGRDEERE